MFPPERSAQTGPSPSTLPVEKGGHRGRARPLDDQLHALEEEHDRVGDLGVGDSHDRVEAVGQDALRQLARLLHGDPVRDRDPARLEAHERSAIRGLHADEVDLGPKLAQGERDPGREAAAADRHDERLHVAELLGELEAERSLPGHDRLVLEGMDEGRAGRFAFVRRPLRLVEPFAGQKHLGAVAPRRVDLGHRRIERHEHCRRHAGLPRGERHRLAVIPGARGHDPRGALLVRHRRELVDRAADLERARPLQVLRLEEDLAAAAPAERLGGVDRCLAREAVYALAGCLDLSECRACRRLHEP